jgi:hypothetical protein
MTAFPSSHRAILIYWRLPCPDGQTLVCTSTDPLTGQPVTRTLYSGQAGPDSSFPLGPNVQATCTITNDDQAARITVVKNAASAMRKTVLAAISHQAAECGGWEGGSSGSGGVGGCCGLAHLRRGAYPKTDTLARSSLEKAVALEPPFAPAYRHESNTKNVRGEAPAARSGSLGPARHPASSEAPVRHQKPTPGTG